MNKSENILFFLNYSAFYLNDRTSLKLFLNTLCKKEGHRINEIRIIFCDRKEIREINQRFLAHDYVTDIITFPFSEEDEPIEGELYICIPKVKEQAREWNSSYREELHRVIFHGLLHLCGYGDKTEEEIKQMREKENYYLKKYFRLVPRGTRSFPTLFRTGK